MFVVFLSFFFLRWLMTSTTLKKKKNVGGGVFFPLLVFFSLTLYFFLFCVSSSSSTSDAARKKESVSSCFEFFNVRTAMRHVLLPDAKKATNAWKWKRKKGANSVFYPGEGENASIFSPNARRFFSFSSSSSSSYFPPTLEQCGHDMQWISTRWILLDIVVTSREKIKGVSALV